MKFQFLQIWILEAIVASNHPAIRTAAPSPQLSGAGNLLVVSVKHDFVVTATWALVYPQLDSDGHEVFEARTANRAASGKALPIIVFGGVQA